MNEPRELPSEADIAALLDRSLQECWSAFAGFPKDDQSRSSMAARAISLYRQTDVSMAARANVYAEPIDYAISALRDIADGYALLANRWTAEEQVVVPLPVEPLLEWLIRAHGVDDWAARFGYDLQVEMAAPSYEAWSREQAAAPDLPGDLPSAFGTIIDAYDTVLVMRETQEGRDQLLTEEYRDAACREIWSSRAWATWGRMRGGDHTAPLTAAMILIAQGFFVQCWATSENEVFPTRRYLRELLRNSSAAESLAKHRVSIPSWLT